MKKLFWKRVVSILLAVQLLLPAAAFNIYAAEQESSQESAIQIKENEVVLGQKYGGSEIEARTLMKMV